MSTWNSMACFNLGIMVFPIENFGLAFSIYNLSFSKFTLEESKFEVPTIFYLGLKYQFSELLFLATEASLSLKENFTASIGRKLACLYLLNKLVLSIFAPNLYLFV